MSPWHGAESGFVWAWNGRERQEHRCRLWSLVQQTFDCRQGLEAIAEIKRPRLGLRIDNHADTADLGGHPTGKGQGEP